MTPSITIKDSLRVLQTNDPDSYFRSRKLVPADMLPDLERAKIVITKYHAFKPRETMEMSKTVCALLRGRCGKAPVTIKTKGAMLSRAMNELMGFDGRNGGIVVINNEAHHRYREKPGTPDDDPAIGDDRKKAERNKEAARLWISSMEAAKRKLGITAVYGPVRHPVLPARGRGRGSPSNGVVTFSWANEPGKFSVRTHYTRNQPL